MVTRSWARNETVPFLGAAQADAKNGVLTVRMPKHRAAKPRTIPIRPR